MYNVYIFSLGLKLKNPHTIFLLQGGLFMKLFTRCFVSFTFGLVIGYIGKNAILGQSIFALILMIASIISYMLISFEWHNERR